jgi:general secretion pathway protein D
VENFAPGTDAQNATSMVNKQAMEAYGGGGLNWQVKTEPRDVSQSEYYTKGQPGKERKPGETLQNVLVKMIQDTIEPHTWDTMGGSGHIEFYPMNMSLIVSQTPDVQEQVQQLLDRLRELQNLQVTVEVRFIELDENFYERIGVDFDVDIQSASAKFQRMVTTGVFTPAGQINEPQHVREVVGLAPQGNITQDLNIPIHNSSYDLATPPFGGFPGRPGANGGLDFGIAFLSDIQVFLVMEAAQGDSRNNLLTAPKITLFNGQQASITQNQTQPYVANVIVIPGNFGGLPGIVPILGTAVSQTSLTVQAVVSADRRYVQLTLVPIISRTTIGTNPNFQPSIGGPGGTIQIQQPITTTLTVGTTVSVPDGGTILMGGLKIANEGRREFGPPILSKLPYINRLFRNVGYGREESSLLLMVTPHIIIPEEEEERLGTTFAF